MTLAPGTLGLDHAGRPADYSAWAAEARRRGYRCDLRYVCRPETRSINRSKIARPDEVAAARAAGLDVALIWQDGKEQPDTMRGAEGGRADGIEAARQAAALGSVGGCVIFVAVDFDAREAQFPTIVAYLEAFRVAAAGWPLGVYGSARVIDRFVGYGPASFGMQTTAWSAGRVSVHTHLLQRLDKPRVDIAGVTCDHDEVLVPFPSWPAEEAALHIVSRSEWGARAPKTRYTMPTPTQRLWLHHAAGEYQGAAGVKSIQNFHMDSKGWADIAYSFLVDDDLTVYEGRGAGVVGAHTEGDNSSSHGICVMGNYQDRDPGDALVVRIAELVAHGARQGWWPNQLTGGHRQAPGAATACPGERLFRRIADINWLAAGAPAAPPPPPPPIDSPIYDYEEDTVRTKLIGPVTLDANGNGWTRWDPGFGRAPIPVAVMAHGPYPPVDGYWYGDAQPMLSTQVRGNELIIAVSGGRAGGGLNVFAAAA